MAEQPVLVAGKSGQLARCLHDSAILHNVPIVVVGRPELDLEKGEGINRVMAAVEPSAIVNAAAYTAVDQAEAESGRSFRVNCGGAALLADAATRRGIPFIHISTDYVFDGSKQSPYREDDAPAPLNVYGSSKLAGEAAVLKVCPGAVVIRTSWVYSPYGNNFVRTMLRLSETQPVVRIVDDQRGTPTSAVDLAAAVLAFGFLPGDLHLKSVSTSWKCQRNCAHAERDRTRGRQWNEALPDHTRCEQAVAADLRQADDLLSAVDLDVGRYPRHSHYHHASGSFSVRTAARRWQPMGHSSHLCRAAQTRRACRSLYYRGRLYRKRSGGHGAGGQHLLWSRAIRAR